MANKFKLGKSDIYYFVICHLDLKSGSGKWNSHVLTNYYAIECERFAEAVQSVKIVCFWTSCLLRRPLLGLIVATFSE